MRRASCTCLWWDTRVVHVSDDTCELRLSLNLCTEATITWRIKIKELDVGPVLAEGGGIGGGGRWSGLLEAVQVLLLRLGYHLSHDVIFIHPIRKTCLKQCKTIYFIHKTLKNCYLFNKICNGIQVQSKIQPSVCSKQFNKKLTMIQDFQNKYTVYP